MNVATRKIGFLLLNLVVIAGLAASSAFAAKGKTFTGTVSDAMCGAKHAMPGDDANCTRACVCKGSKYALVVGRQSLHSRYQRQSSAGHARQESGSESHGYRNRERQHNCGDRRHRRSLSEPILAF